MTSAAAVSALPALAADHVHVWHIALAQGHGEVRRLSALLSPDEAERAARFHFERDRRRFAVGRAALREILAEYAGVPAADLRFAYAAHGKPALTAPRSAAGLRFNLSHSDEVGLCAVSLRREIGIDVERIRPLDDLDQLADQLFSPRERAALGRLTGPARVAGFFNAWTRKEAFVKALGEGLSHPLERFDVSLAPDAPARLERIDGDAERASRWWLSAVDAGGEYTAAVVVRGGGAVLVRQQWPDDLVDARPDDLIDARKAQ